MLLNVYLHEGLDVPSHFALQTAPYARYADDILFTAASPSEVLYARNLVSEKLRAIGMTCRTKSVREATFDLRKSGCVEWLGFKITVVDDEVVLRPGKFTEARLRESLKRARRRGCDATYIARRVLFQSIEAFGPAWNQNDAQKLLSMFRRALAANGFGELFDEDEIRNRLTKRRDKWDAYCRSFQPSVSAPPRRLRAESGWRRW